MYSLVPVAEGLLQALPFYGPFIVGGQRDVLACAIVCRLSSSIIVDALNAIGDGVVIPTTA